MWSAKKVKSKPSGSHLFNQTLFLSKEGNPHVAGCCTHTCFAKLNWFLWNSYVLNMPLGLRQRVIPYNCNYLTLQSVSHSDLIMPIIINVKCSDVDLLQISPWELFLLLTTWTLEPLTITTCSSHHCIGKNISQRAWRVGVVCCALNPKALHVVARQMWWCIAEITAVLVVLDLNLKLNSGFVVGGKHAVDDMIASAALWCLWKLGNHLCFQNGTWLGCSICDNPLPPYSEAKGSSVPLSIWRAHRPGRSFGGLTGADLMDDWCMVPGDQIFWMSAW